MKRKLFWRPKASLGLLVAMMASAAIAQSANSTDAMADWIAKCTPYQEARQNLNSVQIGIVADRDWYLKGAAAKPVAGVSPAQAAAGITGNFNCNGMVQGAFGDMFNQVGSFMGFNFGSLFSSVVGSEAGNLCGQVNQAIGTTFGGLNLQCPTVNIPGFNNSCGVGLRATPTGVALTGTGVLAGNNATATASGVTYQTPQTPQYQAPRYQTPQPANPGVLTTIGNNVACWVTGNCGQ